MSDNVSLISKQPERRGFWSKLAAPERNPNYTTNPIGLNAGQIIFFVTSTDLPKFEREKNYSWWRKLVTFKRRPLHDHRVSDVWNMAIAPTATVPYQSGHIEITYTRKRVPSPPYPGKGFFICDILWLVFGKTTQADMEHEYRHRSTYKIVRVVPEDKTRDITIEEFNDALDALNTHEQTRTAGEEEAAGLAGIHNHEDTIGAEDATIFSNPSGFIDTFSDLGSEYTPRDSRAHRDILKRSEWAAGRNVMFHNTFDI